MMMGSKEYVLGGRTTAVYEALHQAVCFRHYDVFEADARHLRLGFRLGCELSEAPTVVRCAVLDAGHGLAKIVLVCFDDTTGTVIAPGAALDHLLVQVEHRVHDHEQHLAIARAS